MEVLEVETPAPAALPSPFISGAQQSSIRTTTRLVISTSIVSPSITRRTLAGVA
jgi:hypothetical protein